MMSRMKDMSDRYDEFLEEIKALDYSLEEYEHIKEIVEIDSRAKIRLQTPSELFIKDKIEISISLMGTGALLNAYKGKLGENAYIVNMNEKGQVIKTYMDGQIEIVKGD